MIEIIRRMGWLPGVFVGFGALLMLGRVFDGYLPGFGNPVISLLTGNHPAGLLGVFDRFSMELTVMGMGLIIWQMRRISDALRSRMIEGATP